MSATNSSSQASSQAPASVQDILHAYSWNEQTDKEVLLAILKAKAAEDQRIAALASLNEQCVAYAMQIQQEQNITTSRAPGSGAAAVIAQGSSSSTLRGASPRNRSSIRTGYGNPNSMPPSPPYTPNAIVPSSSSARASESRSYNNQRREPTSSVRAYHHPSGEHQQYPPPTISLPPIQATTPHVPRSRGSVSSPRQQRLSQPDDAASAYPAPQHKMDIQNFLSGGQN